MLYRLCLAALALATLAGSVAASPLDFPRRVLFVGTEDTQRTKAFIEFLEKHFADVRVAKRSSFDPASAEGVDVVLLDWSQQEAKFPKDPSPLGKRDDWKPRKYLLAASTRVAANLFASGHPDRRCGRLDCRALAAQDQLVVTVLARFGPRCGAHARSF